MNREHAAAGAFGDARVLAAGDERLPAADAVEHERLPLRVELREHVVEHKHGVFVKLVVEDLPLGELERQRRRACLPLRGERARRLTVDVDEQIVLVRAREALSAVKLRAAVRV